jgi:hypothetical protein
VKYPLLPFHLFAVDLEDTFSVGHDTVSYLFVQVDLFLNHLLIIIIALVFKKREVRRLDCLHLGELTRVVG